MKLKKCFGSKRPRIFFRETGKKLVLVKKRWEEEKKTKEKSLVTAFMRLLLTKLMDSYS